MEIRYIRKLMSSHMIVENAGIPDEWEIKMLSHVSPKHLLIGEHIVEDGKSTLWYEITGRQSLDVILQDEKLGYENLCRILMTIYEVVENLEEILLPSENILLLPECIYFDYQMQNVYLCYYPTGAQVAEDTFMRFIEYILEKLEHQEERAVALAYEIYAQTRGGGWNLRKLGELVSLSYEKDVDDEYVEEVEENEKEAILKEMEVEDGGGGPKLGMISLWKYKVKERIKEITQNIFSGKKTKRTQEESAYVFEPEKEEQIHRPTMLIKDSVQAPEGILQYEGAGGCKDLKIEGEEFLIGSDSLCVGFIPSSTVSRRHARISKSGDVYFLEDLNSSNGTYVGGELLSYKTKVSLNKNEIIIFADEKFRFI